MPESTWTPWLRPQPLLVAAIVVGAGHWGTAAPAPGAVERFRDQVRPVLEKYCYDCHGDGMRKGNVSFDTFATDADLVGQAPLWLAALKNVRAGVMPPDDGPRPTAEEIARVSHWIKYDAFGIDPAHPDPGRVALRRLNRVEYRNTIRDLMGIDFNSEAEFPADDTGHGFDNNGDVLTISPLHLEKYLQAAEAVVSAAVPTVSRIMPVLTLGHGDFRNAQGGKPEAALNLSRPASLRASLKVPAASTYTFALELEVRGSFDFNASEAWVRVGIDGEERFREKLVWAPGRKVPFAVTGPWTAGSHEVTIDVEPINPPPPGSPPPLGPEGGETRVTVRVSSLELKGPVDPAQWVKPPRYERFFPEGAPPEGAAARLAYAERVLRRFTTRAFRRPADDAKVAQLVEFARQAWSHPGTTVEAGLARAFMAVLASPRFLFRLEAPLAADANERFPRVDEYALASRLSYFLWSSQPDDALLALAERGELRRQLPAQIERMLADSKAEALTRNFVGQWLQARDVESVPINLRAALGIPRGQGGRVEFSVELRQAMRRESELCFEDIVRQNRSVLELIESDSTFLNQALAQHYGIPDVTGPQFRKVQLPEGSPRGGILTQGTFLAVTSNPTRTSPVKRGLFILENILGLPPPPPPANVPDLEEAKKEFKGREPTLREMLALHRENALCSSCHSRMDPLGLALERFNVVGSWRDTEAGQPIQSAGQLITGETFDDVRGLKRILVTDRRLDYYRCLTEKLMTYALGRGIEAHDLHGLDEIVEALEVNQGRFSVLLTGVVQSAPFQRQRATHVPLQTALAPSHSVPSPTP
ncbi:MAG: DUF1592 domain-containing protein [Opitutaceae bacterium]